MNGKQVAIAILVLGVGIAVGAMVFMVKAQPKAGAVVMTIALPGEATLRVRSELGGDRNFIEYRDRAYTWQGLIPPYAGLDGGTAVAANDKAIMVRVLRNGNEQIFSFARPHDSRLGTISLGPSTGAMRAAAKQLGGRVWTFGDTAYHLVPSGPNGVAMSAFNLQTGKAFWKVDLAPALFAKPPVAGPRGLTLHDGAREVVLAAATGLAGL
ncbi:MAG: hypothetical protein IPL79_12610 [Myxococcales bacterium]|nr:hypothetical protein [Myxococcales bacterium]